MEKLLGCDTATPVLCYVELMELSKIYIRTSKERKIDIQPLLVALSICNILFFFLSFFQSI